MIQIMHLPVDKVKITSGYGYRQLGGKKEHHNGVDIAPQKHSVSGDKLYAISGGKVVVSKAQGGITTQGYGYYIIIEHDGFCTLYGHMKALGLAVGQIVKAGDVIGSMGNTGNSTGVHVHFEIREGKYDNGFWKTAEFNKYIKCIDPEPILNQYLSAQKKQWLQIEGEAAIKRLDKLTFGQGLDMLNSPEKWIEIINNPNLAKEQFRNTSDLLAFIFIMLDRISQK